MAENVRAALTLVARGEAPLGIVYETDAKVEPKREDRRRIPAGLASADRLSGGGDRHREARGGCISRLPALAGAQSDVREIRLHFLVQAAS